MDYYIHTASRFIVNLLLGRRVNHLIKVAGNSIKDGKFLETLVVSPVGFKLGVA